MLAQLEFQGLLSVLDEDKTSLSDPGKLEEGGDDKKDPKKSEKDLRVRSLFSTCLSDESLLKIMHEETDLEYGTL